MSIIIISICVGDGALKFAALTTENGAQWLRWSGNRQLLKLLKLMLLTIKILIVNFSWLTIS